VLAISLAGAGATIHRVPTISRFFGIVIAMFFDDHGHPHFHARHAEGEAKVRIDNLERSTALSGEVVTRLLAGDFRWRDPDSNRGHHDFQWCCPRC
jgi:hypothetical protein